MSRTVSPSTNQPYGVARVSSVWNLARSSFYAARQREQHPHEPQKRGPKVLSDAELMAEIRELLAQPVLTGEGYRKIWARLRLKGVRAPPRIASCVCSASISCCRRRGNPSQLPVTRMRGRS